MSSKKASNQIKGDQGVDGLGSKELLGLASLTLVLVASLFLSAGRLDWGIAWGFIVMRVGLAFISAWLIKVKYPQLLGERFHPGEGVQTWDRPLSTITTLLWPVLLIVAGLDMRFDRSPDLSWGIQWAAFVIGSLGDGLSKWAALSNRFYSRMVRIQVTLEHTVVSEGPYRLVRHPGYAGAIVAGFTAPFILDSLWALIPGVLLDLLLVFRTAYEDQFLQQELPGYTEYCHQTRCRLLPGIW